MQTVLKSLHSVPGVMGCLLIDDDGNTFANSLPSIFDAAALKEISSLVAHNMEGLQDFTGGVAAIDFRFEQGRIIAKKMSKYVIIVLCQQTLNTQLLQISLNVAISKLVKLLALAPAPVPFAPQPPVREAPQAAPAVSSVRSNDKGIILTTRILDSGDMSANSVIGPVTAAAISTYFRGLEYKNLLLTNTNKGKSVKVPVKIISNDPEGIYNGIIGITPSIAGDLGAKNGDDLLTTVATSKGFFG